MNNLPEWKLTLCSPLYDTSSKSPIEMTAQVYAKTRELVEAFNKLAEDMSSTLNNHIVKTNQDIDDFKKEVTCIMNDYMKSVDNLINGYDSTMIKIRDEIDTILKEASENVDEANRIVEEAETMLAEVDSKIEAITVGLSYNGTEEGLTIGG